MYQALLDLWTIRPCFICEKRGLCDHREIEVDCAALERDQMPSRKPPARQPYSIKSLKTGS